MIHFHDKLQSFSRTNLGNSEAKLSQIFTQNSNTPIITIIYYGSSCTDRQKWSLFCASENLSYILYLCSNQEDFRNIQNKRAQNHTESMNKNSIVIMRTVLRLHFFFLFSQKLPLLQEATRSNTPNKKIHSQCKIPAKKKSWSQQLVGN